MQLQAENPQLSAIVLKAEINNDPLTPVEAWRYQQLMYSTWNTFEVAYKFYEKGLLSEDDYESWLAANCHEYNIPSVNQLVVDGTISLNRNFLLLLETRCKLIQK